MICAADASLTASEVFKPARTSVSVSFTQRHTENGNTFLEDYWVSRGVLGLSFRVTLRLKWPVTEISVLYPDADPFLMRIAILPTKSLCYQSVGFKKDYPFDPHRIDFHAYWHRLTDNAYGIASRERLKVVGMETVSGYRCKKVEIGPLPESGWIVWYSPDLDLLLQSERYEYGHLESHSEAIDIKEGPISSDLLKFPPGCTVKTLSPAEFDREGFRIPPRNNPHD